MKFCTGCSKSLPIHDFGRNRRKNDGFQARCKSCVASYRSDWLGSRPHYHRDRYRRVNGTDRAMDGGSFGRGSRKERRARRAEYLRRVRRFVGCQECGGPGECFSGLPMQPSWLVNRRLSVVKGHLRQCRVLCLSCLRGPSGAETARRIKSERGCAICGERNPAALDYHHTHDKSFELAEAGSRSHGEVVAEIEKCVVLCANHHRMLHAGEIELPSDAAA